MIQNNQSDQKGSNRDQKLAIVATRWLKMIYENDQKIEWIKKKTHGCCNQTGAFELYQYMNRYSCIIIKQIIFDTVVSPGLLPLFVIFFIFSNCYTFSEKIFFDRFSLDFC